MRKNLPGPWNHGILVSTNIVNIFVNITVNILILLTLIGFPLNSTLEQWWFS